MHIWRYFHCFHPNLLVLCPQTHYTIMLNLSKIHMTKLNSNLWKLFLHRHLNPRVLFANHAPFFFKLVIVVKLTWKVSCHRLKTMISGDCYQSDDFCCFSKASFTRYQVYAISPTHYCTDSFTPSCWDQLKL